MTEQSFEVVIRKYDKEEFELKSCEPLDTLVKIRAVRGRCDRCFFGPKKMEICSGLDVFGNGVFKRGKNDLNLRLMSEELEPRISKPMCDVVAKLRCTPIFKKVAIEEKEQRRKRTMEIYKARKSKKK